MGAHPSWQNLRSPVVMDAVAVGSSTSTTPAASVPTLTSPDASEVRPLAPHELRAVEKHERNRGRMKVLFGGLGMIGMVLGARRAFKMVAVNGSMRFARKYALEHSKHFFRRQVSGGNLRAEVGDPAPDELKSTQIVSSIRRI